MNYSWPINKFFCNKLLMPVHYNEKDTKLLAFSESSNIADAVLFLDAGY